MKEGGLIGFGYWGKILSKTLRQTKPSLSLWVFDTSKKAQREALREGFSTVSSLDDLLSVKDISFLVVATPPGSHLYFVRKGLKAGKHILVEKPFGFYSESKEAVFQLARQKKRTLMVDYTYVYSPGFQQLKKHLKYTQMISYESLRLGAGLARKDIGVVEDLMIHDLSMLLQLAPSRPLFCSCQPVSYGVSLPVQQTFATIYGKNWEANLWSSRIFPKKIRTVVVRTPGRTIQFEEEGGKTFVNFFNKEADSLKKQKIERRTSLENMFFEFFKRIRTKKYSKDKDEYVHISYLLKKLNQSLKLKGKRVRLQELQIRK